MSHIQIIGLGAFHAQMTAEATEALFSAKQLFLQTSRCTMAATLDARGIPYHSFDALYDAAPDFDALNDAIAHALAEAAQIGDVVFATLGQPAGLPALPAIIRHADPSITSVTVLPSPGYADAAIATVAGRTGFVGCFQRRFANDLGAPDPNLPLAVEEVDSRLIASDAKLALLDVYPDEFPVTVAIAGERAYALRTIHLFELDQLDDDAYAHSTCLLLPVLPFERKTRFSERDLEDVIRRLRAPGGCPWDREQTHASIRMDLLEEAYEVAEAIDLADDDKLTEELGDLLMQVTFHAVMAEERGAFVLRDVVTGICQKLIYRHPHVFSDWAVGSTAEVLENWEALKRTEKDQKSFADTLVAVPKPLPALTRAAKLQKKAAKAGFDWPDVQGALEKCVEERDEFLAELDKGDREACAEEMGDWLFALVNAARLSGLDPELCLTAANEKFLERFARMECLVQAAGKSLEQCDLSTLDGYWEQAKRLTK